MKKLQNNFQVHPPLQSLSLLPEWEGVHYLYFFPFISPLFFFPKPTKNAFKNAL